MASFQKGILSGFSGKVGTVIGGNWKGIDYMRSKGVNGNKNPTLPQLTQQLKFKLCINFIQTMAGLVAISFKPFAVQKTGINSALSYTLQNAVLGCTRCLPSTTRVCWLAAAICQMRWALR